MSTLSVSNITDGTDTVETGYVVNGSAKAWCMLSQSATNDAFYDSYNFSSSTDDGTGKTTVTFASGMANANYATPSMTESGTGFNDMRTLNRDISQTRGASSYSFYNCHSNSSADNSQYVSIVFFGDLA